ncbi:MAG: head GIN domain-containing protein [Chitinophagaceae bacterium]
MQKFFILLLIVVTGFSSCRYRNHRHVSGNGALSTEQRSVTGFTGVETHGSIDIVASQGNFGVKVEAEQNLLQYIETVVENGHLMVRFKHDMSFTDFRGVKVYVSAPEWNAFETHGNGDIQSQGKISGKEKMDINIAGNGDVSLAVDCPQVNVEIHGNGDLEISGETRDLISKTNGSGDLKAANLKAENVKTSIHGSGDNEVFASVSLEAEISGSGDVHYRGEPKVSMSVHGSGEVSKMD